jgi:hypothetical protein
MLNRSLRSFLTLTLLTVLLLLSGVWLSQRTIAQDPATSAAVFYVAPDGDDHNQGTLAQPWATIQHAASRLQPGETVYIRAGIYAIAEQIRAQHSGTADAWIVYAAYPGERVVIDAEAIVVAPPSGQPPFPQDQGAFQLENVSYIRVKHLEVTNSHNAGFTVRDSDHVELYNNKTENTFASGIGVWNGQHHKIMGNTVINANTHELLPVGFPDDIESPHEAISLGGVAQFEVAYNLVHNGKKEGIDIKETSRDGSVHHNYIHHMNAQGLYVDSWFGVLENVEVMHNVVHDCKGAGFALSVEGGSKASNITVQHNLLYDNWGTGILFSRWGEDGLREGIKIDSNTVHHNGYGQPNPGERFHWITGGLYLFSDHLQGVKIRNNIFSKNAGFQMGYSDRYLTHSSTIDNALQQRHIVISQNLIFGINSPDHPIYAGWPDNYANIYATQGDRSITGDPRYLDPETGNFYLHPDSPAILPADATPTPETVGAFPFADKENLWWQTAFPPTIPDR